MIPTDPKNTKKDIDNTIRNIKRAALAYINKENIKIKQKAIDKGKFDYNENQFYILTLQKLDQKQTLKCI